MSDTFTIGSLSARLVTAPPVYDPGGAVCLADSLLTRQVPSCFRMLPTRRPGVERL